MPTESELIETICAEFTKAQKGHAPKWKPTPGQISFPPSLSVGDGQHLNVTDKLLDAVDDYAGLLRLNSAALRSSFSLKEFRSSVSTAFGKALSVLGTADPKAPALAGVVEPLIQAEIDNRKRDADLLVGCWLFEDNSVYPLEIGPVRFDRRSVWLGEQTQAGSLSKTTSRRLGKAWAGKRLRPRKSGIDGYRETAISEAVDRCPIVCRVRTHGLSSDLIRQKGLLAARLAMAALSLRWANSQQTLERMNLVYDGGPRSRHYAVMWQGGGFGSGTSIVTTPFGQHSQEPLKPSLQQIQPTFDVIADSLTAYVNPHANVQRPKIANAVFLSLFWFHQGCRESSDQIAVTAFAASLDALAGGGKAKGIKELVEARLGFAPSAALMNDGRTAGAVVDAVYNAARSRFIHGSSVDYVEDWEPLRTTAMIVARLVLLHTTHWLHQNPTIDDVKALRK